MAKEQDCLSPVTIGGIKITPELIDALKRLKSLRPDCALYFAEQCMNIATLDYDERNLDKDIYFLFVDFLTILKELTKDREGGLE